MKTVKEVKTWRLTVRLVKDGLDVVDFIKTDKVDEAKLQVSEWPPIDGSRVYIGNAFGNPPKWTQFFNDTISLPSMDNRGSVAIMIIPLKGKRLVVSFGPAQIFLNSDCFVRDFGLRVTLNSVSENDLLSVDAKAIEEFSLQKRIQTSKSSDITAFGINVESDLLKAAAGELKDSSFARKVAGADSLTLISEVSPSTLHAKCEEILANYESENYKKHYSWIDNVKIVKDPVKLDELDGLLVEELNQCISDPSRMTSAYLAIPEIVDPNYESCFCFMGLGKMREAEREAVVTLENYFKILKGREISIEHLKKHKIGQIIDESDKAFEKWSIFRCLIYEVEIDGYKYCFSEGEWFQINIDYAKSIDEYFHRIYNNTDSSRIKQYLPAADWNDNETTYIKKLTKSLEKGKMVCLDQDGILAKDWNSSVEPCDFFTIDKDFIHIKNETSSSTLSHLFMQGNVSAQVFNRSEDFRMQLKQKVTERDSQVGITLPVNTPETSRYNVVYAILRRPYKNGEFNLPFFSKVALKTVVERLNDLRFNVEVYWIEKVKV